MRSGRTIRSELVADRENRRGTRQRVNEMAFGVYRPLSEDSREQIQTALNKAKKRVAEHFAERGGNNKFTELIIPQDHGVTYVRRDRVRRAMGTSAMKNFSFDRIRNEIDHYNYCCDESPTVPIERLDWVGPSNLKLAGRFAIEGAEAQELAEESEQIGTFLEEAGGRQLDVYQPDHVTLCRFRRSRRGHDLDVMQKYDIKMMVQEELTAADIGSVTLEEVVMSGHGYSGQPPTPAPVPALA